jgi:hypothetical protein
LRPASGRGGAAAGPPVPDGRQPVEIAVTGAEPLLTAGSARRRAVDVVVTTDDAAGGGRTYVAAEGVRLLGLRASEDESLGGGVAGLTLATLALRRAQALRLIRAQSFAREVRLISHP